jgi:hypothetical protein
MKKQALLVIALVALLVSACSPASQSPLDRNRALWEAQGIRHYRFDLTIGCFCVFNDQMPLTIEVQDGQVVSMSAAGGADIGDFRDFYSGFDTLEKLFDTIAEAVAGQAQTLEVQYDPTYGYPASIYVDPEELVADDEVGYDVANFQILP